MAHSSAPLDLKEALETARALVQGAKATFEQRLLVFDTVEWLSRALERLKQGGEIGGLSEATQPLSRNRVERIEAEATQRRLEFAFNMLSALHNSPLEPQARAERLVMLLVPDLADWCLCDLMVDGELRRVAVRTWAPGKEQVVAGLLGGAPLDAEARFGMHRVLHEGQIEFASQVELPAEPHSPSEARFVEMIRTLGVKSYMVVPLQGAGSLLGTLTFLFAESNRHYNQDDLALAEALAAPASIALKNATLFQDNQRAIQIRNDILGIVSHDLRNPLANIKSSALLQQQGIPDNPDQPQRSKSAIILRSVDRMERLIRDLLDVSSLEAGGMTVRLAPQPLHELMQEVNDLIAPLAAERSLTFRLEAPGEPCSVLCDRERLLQVFSNLLGNAVKFTPKGGEIGVSAQLKPGACEFKIHDTGPGIPADQLPHIFDRFWQARPRRGEGAGLGLSIVKGILKGHGSTIEVRSVVGQGTQFSFSIALV